MDYPLKTLFFMPVFNQVHELPTVLEEIETAELQNIDFLLINNGSTDGSEKMVRESNHYQLEIERNQGIGFSYLMALDWARERDYDIFGTMASNGKMIPSEIPRLIEPIEDGRADYTSGSRFMAGGRSPNLPWFRRLSIPLVNRIAKWTTGQKLTDATNGFRAFRLSIIEQAEFDLRADWLHTYEFEYFLYAKALREPHLKCIEVPTTMRYPESGRYSKIRPGLDWWPMIKPWFRARSGPGFRFEGTGSHPADEPK